MEFDDRVRELPKVLSVADEIRLAQAIEVGVLAEEKLRQPGVTDDAELAFLVTAGRRAWREFLSANLRLVFWAAARNPYRGLIPRAELVSEGSLGLIDALLRFDYLRGVRFASYALPWIRYRMNRFAQSVIRERQVARSVAEISGSELSAPGLAVGRPVVAPALAALDRGSYSVLLLRFGFHGSALTQKQTAQELGLKVSQVRSIERRAIGQVRELLAAA